MEFMIVDRTPADRRRDGLYDDLADAQAALARLRAQSPERQLAIVASVPHATASSAYGVTDGTAVTLYAGDGRPTVVRPAHGWPDALAQLDAWRTAPLTAVGQATTDEPAAP